MPPKPIVSKEDVFNAAFELTRTEGIEMVNARSVAKVLNCSTKPIFRVYQNMNELKHDIYTKAEALYTAYMEKGLTQANPFQGMGLAYITFAQQERNLFKVIFMSEQFDISSMDSMLEGKDNEQIINMVSMTTGLSKPTAKNLYMSMWLLSHGIASMIVTNACDLKQEEIVCILNTAYFGIKSQLTVQEKQLMEGKEL